MVVSLDCWWKLPTRNSAVCFDEVADELNGDVAVNRGERIFLVVGEVQQRARWNCRGKAHFNFGVWPVVVTRLTVMELGGLNGKIGSVFTDNAWIIWFHKGWWLAHLR